jgi:hypothetical protein
MGVLRSDAELRLAGVFGVLCPPDSASDDM